MKTFGTTSRAGGPALGAFACGCLLLLAGCGTKDVGSGSKQPSGVDHPLLGTVTERRVDEGGAPARLRKIAEDLQPSAGSQLATVVVDDPQEGTLYPPDLAAPTVLWHDAAEGADTWLARLTVDGEAGDPLTVLVPGPHPVQGPIDPEAQSETNELYVPTDYQASARSWTPSAELWAEIKRRTQEKDAVLTFIGFAADNPAKPLSSGQVRFRTSKDPVGAPIFYRDVPLSPAKTKKGVISPLSKERLPLIGWRLRDVGRHDSRLVLSGLQTCTNCHSFSRDGTTLGMDVDGPMGDKGAYAIVPVSQRTVIGYDQVMSWNAFEQKPEGHRTIGFLSRVSPDGSKVVTTLNEALYVSNFVDFRFLQVFYPTRGILAWHEAGSRRIQALPGADDTRYVHCDPAWSPDGKTLVFARAKARDPYAEGKPLAAYPNDPNEPRVRYDLYRMPFNGGRGGKPVPVKGASANGKSNTFPKISPDGRWIVFVKCKNGQLLRPDGRLWIVPLAGGEAREMRCNLPVMNSWHSFSPNGRWMVFVSKSNTPYTQMFLTHLDEEGNDSPAVLVSNATASNRAVNLPEFMNAPYDALQKIEVPAAEHHAIFLKGEELMKAGKYDEAFEIFSQVLEREPQHSVSHMHMGFILGRAGKLEEALQHFRESVRINPENALALNNLGFALSLKGETQEAIRLYRAALAIDSDMALANHNLGYALHGLGQLDEAIVYYRRAVAVQPNYVQAHKNLAYAYYESGDLARSARHYSQALRHAPDDLDSRQSLARVQRQAGSIKQSLEHLEKVVAADGARLQAANVLAWELATHPDASIRNGARAVAVVGPACARTDFRLPGLLDTLAAAYAEDNHFPEAVRTVTRALKQAEDGPPERVHALQRRLDSYRRGRPWRHPVSGGRDPWEKLK